jgi:long-subunit acyl-CoA synthetase (AMP-forming)
MSLLAKQAQIWPEHTAVVFAQKTYSYSTLLKHSNALADFLVQRKITSVCVNMANSYAWIVIDLACQQANIICTAIPQFFSDSQVQHLIDEASPCAVLGHLTTATDSPNVEEFTSADADLSIKVYFTKPRAEALIPNGTQKITFTSGSTGLPKGVCLSLQNQVTVAKSLVMAIGIEQPRHLVLLPLATLLENIAGVYAPLLAGGQIIVPSDKEKGFAGSRLIDLPALLKCISIYRPNTMIVVPELLLALVIACSKGWKPPTSLQFIAVGGAKVDAKLIAQARQYSLPVYQGYGLSECGSVVSLCRPLAHSKQTPIDASYYSQGSAGKVLEHLEIEIVDGELVVSGNCFLGYLGQQDTWYPTKVHTGDLVSIVDQHLFINGRKKHLIINSFSRNISPEWIESKIAASALFAQNIVMGEAKPSLIALLVPIASNISKAAIKNAIDTINSELPDYARIVHYIVLEQAFTYENGLATQNGKLKRSAIEAFYQNQINQQYVQASVALV